MKVYPTESLRNVAVVGHQGSGKTSLCEAFLFATGATNRLGTIEQGNTVSDWDDEEKERNVSLNTSLIPVEIGDVKINLLDTPGFSDFQGDVKNAIRATDAVLIIVDAVSGVQVGTEMVWELARAEQIPILVNINKLDRENADFDRALSGLREAFADANFVPVVLPVGQEADFKGLVNLVTQQAYLGDGAERSELPAELQDAVEEARLNLIEVAAEADDALIEKYFEEETLSEDEIRSGMRLAAKDASSPVVPVFVTRATSNIGTIPLLEAIAAYVPSPEGRRILTQAEDSTDEDPILPTPLTDDGPLAAYVFKSINDRFVGNLTFLRVFSGHMAADQRYFNANREEEERFGNLYVMRGKEQIAVDRLCAGDIGVVTKLNDTFTNDTFSHRESLLQIRSPSFPDPLYIVALEPKTQADSTKMGSVLNSLCNSDPTLRWRYNADVRQTWLEGMGETHIQITLSRAQKLGVALDMNIPKVPYRETITEEAQATYRHKKQTGGAGQFGEVSLRVIPSEEEAFIYETNIFGGAISQQFLPSIEKGIRQVLPEGIIAGFPVVNVKAEVYDGKEHPVDSKDIAFQIAGRESFKIAFKSAAPVLLEPIMDLSITVPESLLGDVMGDLNTRRGRVQGIENDGNRSIVHAKVPLAEMLRYGTDLRSLSGGRGHYEMSFDHYEKVPAQLTDQIITLNLAEKNRD
ncbi:MAG: elongation factor G [Chloroflexi bacterium]|nr:elongation factor G [Chloroflexota bacterium]